jgi:hypothetical protein
MMEAKFQMAFVPDRVSVRHRICCWTLFNGRLTRFILLRVCVSHGSTFVFRTTLTVDLGAKAAAEAGNKDIGMVAIMWDGGNVFGKTKRNKKKNCKEKCLRRNWVDLGALVGRRQEEDGRMRRGGGGGEVEGREG